MNWEQAKDKANKAIERGKNTIRVKSQMWSWRQQRDGSVNVSFSKEAWDVANKEERLLLWTVVVVDVARKLYCPTSYSVNKIMKSSGYDVPALYRSIRDKVAQAKVDSLPPLDFSNLPGIVTYKS